MPAAAGLSSAGCQYSCSTVGSNSRCKKQKAPEQSQCSDLLFSHKSCCQGDTCRHTDIACIPVVVTDGGQQLGPVPFSVFHSAESSQHIDVQTVQQSDQCHDSRCDSGDPPDTSAAVIVPGYRKIDPHQQSLGHQPHIPAGIP